MKVLVTLGGTQEPIDGVRVLTNVSSGKTGAVLAREFQSQGAEVTVLAAESAQGELAGMERVRTFRSFQDLREILEKTLKENAYDAIIHAAAVSDYSVEGLRVNGEFFPAGDQGKLGSGQKIEIVLKPNPKLIDEIKRWSRNPKIVVIGFKFTHTDDLSARRAAAESIAEKSGVDFVVLNDRSGIGPGSRHEVEIFRKKEKIARESDKAGLARRLSAILHEVIV